MLERVDYKNPWIEAVKRGSKELPASAWLVPYEGELKEAAGALFTAKKYEEAAFVLANAVKWYPEGTALFDQLSLVNQKLGRKTPPGEEHFMKLINSGKLDEAVSLYNKTQQEFPGWKLFEEQKMNDAGYRFLQKKDAATAIKIFKLNVQSFPASFNAFDSLGEGYMVAGNKALAKENYERSLQLNPENSNATNMLKSL